VAEPAGNKFSIQHYKARVTISINAYLRRQCPSLFIHSQLLHLFFFLPARAGLHFTLLVLVLSYSFRGAGASNANNEAERMIQQNDQQDNDQQDNDQQDTRSRRHML
jgi:hypothetical protein